MLRSLATRAAKRGAIGARVREMNDNQPRAFVMRSRTNEKIERLTD
jgi:hypothetical protein